MSEPEATRILVVEDDDFIRDILTYTLKKEGYTVLEASCGQEAIRLMEHPYFDLAILDVMLPDTDGFTLCQEISAQHIAPVIMLTAKNDIEDKLTGLQIGADDYITKPFDIREVLVRIRIVLRRYQNQVQATECIYISKNVHIDKPNHEVYVDDLRVDLKRKEYALLLTLAENPNQVFSREKLLQIVWGYDFGGDTRTVDVHIQRIRKKLGFTKDYPVIQTVFGVGYKLVKDV